MSNGNHNDASDPNVAAQLVIVRRIFAEAYLHSLILLNEEILDVYETGVGEDFLECLRAADDAKCAVINISVGLELKR